MKKLLLSVLLCSSFFYSKAQNTSWILAPNYIPNMASPVPTSLPTASTVNTDPSDGYDGQAATAGQNVIVDANGQIVFFMVDEYIYDRNGEIIDMFTSPTGSYNVNGLVSEVAIVPVPDDCNAYYIVSTKRSTITVGFATGYYAKLIVKYDSFGQLLTGSGLAFPVIYDCLEKGTPIADAIGSSVYYAGNNVHDEAPRYAITERANTSNKFLFVLNGTKLFRLTISNTGITYDNYFINLWNAFPENTGISESSPYRQELEIVKMGNGNYRVAFAKDHTLGPPVVNGASKSIFILDLDPNGTLISGSQKIARYDIDGQTSTIEIKGIELSPDGSKLYVTHSEDPVFYGSLDVFDVTVAVPTKTTIENSMIYEYSQVEASSNNTVLIPHANGISRISNANDPFVPANLDLNYISLGIPTSTPYPISPLTTDKHWLRLLQDQVDGMDYSFINTSEFSANTYETTLPNTTWTPNGGGAGNPLLGGNGSIAYIKDELRIKAGTVLTIQDMTLKFAPGARVVIENSTSGLNGGKLIMNNTTFTHDDRCTTEDLWLGVEVWGNQNEYQGNINTSKQGRLLVLNNSRIENAWIGALIGKRTSDIVELNINPGMYCSGSENLYDEVVDLFLFDNARNGGIIQTSNSFFSNNQRGVFFRPYMAANGANNLSRFYATKFEWDGTLVGGHSLQVQARLDEVKGINFKGCVFANETPELYAYTQLGFGIFSRESQFYVTPKCNGIVQVGQPCPSQIISEFKNLRFGIYASNGNSLSFTCKESKFIDNQYGIYVRGTQMEKITQNDFEVRESDQYQSAGLAMYSSSGYKVEDNDFYEFDNPLITNETAFSYGIVVNNSGDVHNEIYRNRFKDLRIGGQTERKNATAIIDASDTPDQSLWNFPGGPNGFEMAGLQWKCNDFQSSLDEHDLTLMYGSMDYHQGYSSGATSLLDAKKRAALNEFSMTGEQFTNAHDIFVSSTSQDLTYAYIDAPRHEPDSYTPNLVDVNEILWNGLPIIDDAGACPSKLIGKIKLVAFAELAQLKVEMANLRSKIEAGTSSSLTSLIEDGDNTEILDALLLASPYLSDEVLLTYIASYPSAGHLKQVMIANSPLSEEVKTALNNCSLPNGVFNQIANVQTGTSARTQLYYELNYLKSQYEDIYFEQIREALLDESEDANFDELISILKEEEDEERLKLLLSTYIVTRDITKAEETRQLLTSYPATEDFVELTIIQENVCTEPSTCDAMTVDQTIESELVLLKNNADDKRVRERAACILDLHSTMREDENFLIETSAFILLNEDEEQSVIDLHRAMEVSVYPNPSTGIVNFDFPGIEAGNMIIQVISLEGKVMAELTAENTNGERMDLSRLNKGFYLVKISIDGVETTLEKLELF